MMGKKLSLEIRMQFYERIGGKNLSFGNEDSDASGKVTSLKCLEENGFIQLQTYTKPLEMTEG